jgi:hypothetical protein
LAYDATGAVYVCGISWNGRMGQSTLLKIDALSGTNVWVARFQGPEWSSADAIQLDPQGNIYLAGHSWIRDPPYDYLVLKYTPDGELQWSKRYKGSASGDDQAKAIAVDKQGNVYVTGYTTTTNGTEITTIKYIQMAPIEKKVTGTSCSSSPARPARIM